jgi:putative ABC transport system permease protein
MVDLARKNLLEDIPRLLVAQAGIMFAVSLVTIETGIFSGFVRSTALIVDRSEADIWLASEEMIHLSLTTPLPVEHLLQARKIEGVDVAEGLLMRSARWRTFEGEIAPVQVIGFDPQGELFSPWNVEAGQVSNLTEPYTAIIDSSVQQALDIESVGGEAEVNFLPVEVVGLTQGNQSIVSSPFLYTSLSTANAYLNAQLKSSVNCTLQDGNIRCTNIYERDRDTRLQQEPPPEPPPLQASDLVTYILVSAESGQDIDQLKQRLEAKLVGVRAYTREEMANRTRDYWKTRTGIGFILGLGAAVGVVVGVVVVGQILYASVSDNIKEFGTLKAMGASDRVLYGVIIEQALWMGVFGYIPGMLLCLGISSIAYSTQGILILITPTTAIAVFGITTFICVSAAVFAIQKVFRIDPAIVFKA